MLTLGLPLAPSARAQETSSGAYIDNLLYVVLQGDEEQVLALQDDDIDLIGDMIDPTHLPTLERASNIRVERTPRNGYGYICIKCDKYPFNITDFRRAVSFATDKYRICEEAWLGQAEPLDSCVPKINPLSIEGELPYSYYDAQVQLGNQLLDAAGFEDWDNDSIREAPNGEEFDVLIEVAQSSNIGISSGEIVAEALQALHIDATCEPTDFYDYLQRLYHHEDYDMVFLGTSLVDFDVDWLAYDYWSENADEPYQNFPCWQNATYDSWRDQLLHSIGYSEVYEAARAMQEIWVHSSPVIVCYENVVLSAYRTNQFEGHVNDVSAGVPSWWTNYRVHLKESAGGPFGGTFRWSNPLDIDSFNFMMASSVYTMNVLNELYDSLIRISPDGEDLLWLAESYTAETHEDNPLVPAGRTRFTFNLVENATWTDGQPLTAEDVAFSLNYYQERPGNPYGPDLSELASAYASSPYTLIAEFETESYWHLHSIGYKPVMPKHIMEEIPPEDWHTWNPNPAEEPMVTSGPFTVSEYVAGSFIELTRNSNYFRSNHYDGGYPEILSAPDDLTYQVRTTGHHLSWSASDENPVWYSLYCDGIMIEGSSWSSGDIEYNVDGLGLGTYEYRLVVEDIGSLTAEHTTTVRVVNDTTPPVLIDHPDIEYREHETDVEINWNATDEYPAQYLILQNGTVFDSGAWNGSIINIGLDGLARGFYNYTLIITDVGGHQVSDTVTVTVLAGGVIPILPGLPISLASLLITLGSVLVIVLFGIPLVRSRRGGRIPSW
jgi:ABC-type transport system substrate-binding protein